MNRSVSVLRSTSALVVRRGLWSAPSGQQQTNEPSRYAAANPNERNGLPQTEEPTLWDSAKEKLKSGADSVAESMMGKGNEMKADAANPLNADKGEKTWKAGSKLEEGGLKLKNKVAEQDLKDAKKNTPFARSERWFSTRTGEPETLWEKAKSAANSVAETMIGKGEDLKTDAVNPFNSDAGVKTYAAGSKLRESGLKLKNKVLEQDLKDAKRDGFVRSDRAYTTGAAGTAATEGSSSSSTYAAGKKNHDLDGIGSASKTDKSSATSDFDGSSAKWDENSSGIDRSKVGGSFKASSSQNLSSSKGDFESSNDSSNLKSEGRKGINFQNKDASKTEKNDKWSASSSSQSEVLENKAENHKKWDN